MASVELNAVGVELIPGVPGSANVTIGTSTITSGNNTRVLYNNSGVLGEYVISGSGSVAMTTSPTFVTPTLGVAIGTSVTVTGTLAAYSGTAIPAGGTTGSGLKVSSTANFGVFFGSGVPSLSAAKGSLYLRSDGTTTNDRAYINTNGTTGWTALTTAG